jgi:hypothetical protein
MALNLKKGERVTMNCGFLACPNCDSGTSATCWPESLYPDKGYSIYTSHHKPVGPECRDVVGSKVPGHIKVERIIKHGVVLKDAPSGEYGKGRVTWVRWDGEDEDTPCDIFNLRREEE